MLEIKDLSFSYDKNTVLFSNLSFELFDGDILSIVGVNGAGKTTLLRCIMQTIKEYAGEIIYDGENIKKQSLEKRSRLFGLVSTNDIISSDIPVVDYLCMGAANQIAFFSSPIASHYKSAYKICEKYGVSHLADRNLRTLSQGELQLVTLLRVLMQDPKVIILDEPTAALDIRNQRLLLEIMKELADSGKIIIQVTHNLDHIFDLSGKVLILSGEGHIYGKADEILTEKQLSEIYKTEVHLIKFGEKYKVVY